MLDRLLGVFKEVLFLKDVKDLKDHPIVNTYNPIKCSLLIYEICFKIENKNIYSMQRDCTQIKKYLEESLIEFLAESQEEISHIYKLMREPILHSRE